eukprot:XP_001694313.1 predicted protein [Chlamydomonas reinhardtii]
MQVPLALATTGAPGVAIARARGIGGASAAKGSGLCKHGGMCTEICRIPYVAWEHVAICQIVIWTRCKPPSDEACGLKCTGAAGG